jgi:hypothetical protein
MHAARLLFMSEFLIDFMPAMFQEMMLIASLRRDGTFPRKCAVPMQDRVELCGVA